MDTLQSQLKQVEDQLAAENGKGAEKSPSAVSILEQRQADLLKQIMDEKQATIAAIPTMSLADLQTLNDKLLSEEPLDTELLNPVQARIAELERTETQEQKVQDITLPYNFNDLYDNSTANATIIELIQQDRRQVYADHNAEIEQLHATYRDQLRGADEREIQLKRQNDDLQTEIKLVTADRDQAKTRLQELSNEVADAQSKRDAAVRELEDAKSEIERLNGHINDLRTDAAVGARNTPNVINANDKLDQLVKQSNAEKAARALASFNARNPELAVPPLEVPQAPATFPDVESTVDQVHNINTQATDASVQPPSLGVRTFPETAQIGSQMGSGDATAAGGVGTEKAGSAAAEIEHIKARLDRLEKQANLPALEVA